MLRRCCAIRSSLEVHLRPFEARMDGGKVVLNKVNIEMEEGQNHLRNME